MNPWLKAFEDLSSNGVIIAPRGKRIMELSNYEIVFDPIKDRFCSFNSRKLSLSYNFAEFAWYLSGNPNDTRMEAYSKFWQTIKNPVPPFYNSNYGYYFFTEGQFEYVVETLKNDIDSRQASIIINRPSVMMSDSKDKICTNSIDFQIRNNTLNMYVSMRSNDIIKGLGIDANMFGFLYEMVYVMLRTKYQDLKIGKYYHRASSFHIYEEDFQIMKYILQTPQTQYYSVECPLMSGEEEVKYLMYSFPDIEREIREEKKVSYQIPEKFEFTKFLVSKIQQRWNK